MLDQTLIDAFADYIKPDVPNATWLEKGLIDDAPITAKLVFKQLQEIEEDARKRGIEI
jgi:hypothetical protein